MKICDLSLQQLTAESKQLRSAACLRYSERGGRWSGAEKKRCSKVSLIPHFAFGDLPWKANSTSHRQRSLLLYELQVTMATFARPVASSIAGVEFTVFSDEEIKKLSVKRIHNTPTLDSFNNPVPGGLYDPAMGAWGDHMYVFMSIL